MRRRRLLLLLVVGVMEMVWLRQQAWLMQAVVVELRVTSLNRQRSHTERLMALMLDDSFHLQSATTGNSLTSSRSVIGLGPDLQNILLHSGSVAEW